MSTQAIADFILKANEDPDFIAQIEGEKAEDRIASLVAAGHEQGFEFTADECTEFLNTAKALGSGELREEQLAQVAGGVSAKDFFRTTGGAVAPFWSKIVDALKSDNTDGNTEDAADTATTETTDNAVAGVRG